MLASFLFARTYCMRLDGWQVLGLVEHVRYIYSTGSVVFPTEKATRSLHLIWADTQCLLISSENYTDYISTYEIFIQLFFFKKQFRLSALLKSTTLHLVIKPIPFKLQAQMSNPLF